MEIIEENAGNIISLCQYKDIEIIEQRTVPCSISAKTVA